MEGTQPEISNDIVEQALLEMGVGRRLEPAADLDKTPLSRVLVASRKPGAPAELRARVPGKLDILHMPHIGTLMDVSPGSSRERVCLVLDCRSPTMHPASVAALADELPYGWWVVAWGIDSLTWDELEPDRNGNLHWARCPETTEWQGVCELVATLLAAGG